MLTVLQWQLKKKIIRFDFNRYAGICFVNRRNRLQRKDRRLMKKVNNSDYQQRLFRSLRGAFLISPALLMVADFQL